MIDNWYETPRWIASPKHVISAAAVVLNEKEEILLVKSPNRGWEIPGGQVEQGEALRDAAVREVLEESGIHVEITAFCGIFQTVSHSICNTIFLAKPNGGHLTTSDESLEVGWFDQSTALSMITHHNFRDRVKLALDPTQHPFLIEYVDQSE